MRVRVQQAFDQLVQDVRHAARTLRSNPVFAAVAIATLSLGIGASSAIFSIVYGVLLRPLPYPDSSSLLLIKTRDPVTGAVLPAGFSVPDLEDWQDRATAFSQLALCTPNIFAVETPAGLETASGATVSSAFFTVLGEPLAIGRPFANDRAREVVISRRFWRQWFGEDSQVIGRSIRVNDQPYAIVGVASEYLDLPMDTRRSIGAAPVAPDIWVPPGIDPRVTDRRFRPYELLGRLAPGATFDRGEGDAVRIAHLLSLEHPEHVDPVLVPLTSDLTGAVRPALWLLMGAVGLVLLVACANAANLLLARQSARRREIAVRISLGAPPVRLAVQLFAEAAVIAAFGCALGLAIAQSAVSLMLRLHPVQIPRLSDIRLDWPVLAFASGVTVFAALVSAAAPIARLLRGKPAAILIGSRMDAGDRKTTWLRQAIVVAQMAAAIVLLVGSVLLARSFVALLTTNVGVHADHVVAVELNVAMGRSLPDPVQIQLVDRVVARLSAMPDVLAAGAANGLPPNRLRMNFEFDMAGPLDATPTTHRLTFLNSTPGYFKALGIPLLRGRLFENTDDAASPRVAILSAGAARGLFGTTDAVGRSLPIGPKESAVPIVGIVGDVKYGGLDAAPSDMLYLPFAQHPFRNLTLVARTTGEPRDVQAVLSQTIHEVDRDIMLGPPRTLDGIIGDAVAQPRFRMFALGAIAGLALLLSAIGLYGVVAYAVSRRTSEIGVRMALGATPAAIRSMVVREALELVALGSTFGIAGGYLLTRVLRTILYGVAPTDPVSFAVAVAALAAVALAASYIPARRAMRVDPIVALRAD
jgi:putative ABC transport system permease protein